MSSRQATFAVAPQSAADEQADPSHSREMSSASPGYSPAVSTPSTFGAVEAWAMVVPGTSSSAAPALLEPAADVVVIV